MPLPAAIVSAFALVAVPVIVLAGIWAVVTVFRVLVPERPLPPVMPAGRARVLQVGFREIVERQRAATPALPRRQAAGTLAGPAPDPLREELWLRRN